MTTSVSIADGHELQEAISEAMVELYNRHFPAPVSMAETFINKDLVCCVLEGIFDARERERMEEATNGRCSTGATPLSRRCAPSSSRPSSGSRSVGWSPS